jgi:hypothetical protein
MEVYMITKCPACHSAVEIRELGCTRCDVTIRGRFPFSSFFQLTAEQMEFVKTFLKTRGNIKEVEKELGISYPTVRARLNDILKSLGMEPDRKSIKREEILDELARGEISAEEAADRLKQV